MFAGNINDQMVIADQPVLVIDGELVLSSFSRVQEAVSFVKRSRSDTALIFRHNGLNWDVCRGDERLVQ